MSPFDGSLLAIAACQNFGLKGSGRVYIVQLLPGDAPQEAHLIRHFDFRDGVFDVAWSEVDKNVLIAGGGDGKVYAFNLSSSPFKTNNIHSHSKEISSLDWCPLRQDKFLSTSWDGTIKLSNGATIKGHVGVVNEARWSPRHLNLLMSVSGDKTARLWDDRTVASTAVITPHESLMVSDLLSLDWNKYDEWNVVTATPTDLLFWDIRSLTRGGPVNRIPAAHRRAIKRVRFSPWQGNKLASVGFDMAVRSWDLTALNPRGAHFDHYTEFATGLDWSNFERNKLFSCSWDETIRMHKI